MVLHASFSQQALDALLCRSSTDALVDPAPQGEQLRRILSAGLRAPDHGKLRPWRYIVVQGKAREPLAHEVLAAVERQAPTTPRVKKEKRFQRFSEMPMTIGLGMHIQPEHTVPLEEQVMAVSAGAMNVLNALHLEGFAGVWVSGAFCEDRELLVKLGLEAPHRLAGFVFVGTPRYPDRNVNRPNVDDYMVEWNPLRSASFQVDKREHE